MCQLVVIVQQHAGLPTVACTIKFADEQERARTIPPIHELFHARFTFSAIYSRELGDVLPPDVVLATPNGPIEFTTIEHLLQYLEQYVLLKHDSDARRT